MFPPCSLTEHAFERLPSTSYLTLKVEKRTDPFNETADYDVEIEVI